MKQAKRKTVVAELLERKCPMLEKEVLIANKTGLHARPASMFVQTANKFHSKIVLKTAQKEVDAKSILSILSLGLTKGSSVILQVEGDDEEAAMQSLTDLIASKFGEAE